MKLLVVSWKKCEGRRYEDVTNVTCEICTRTTKLEIMKLLVISWSCCYI